MVLHAIARKICFVALLAFAAPDSFHLHSARALSTQYVELPGAASSSMPLLPDDEVSYLQVRSKGRRGSSIEPLRDEVSYLQFAAVKAADVADKIVSADADGSHASNLSIPCQPYPACHPGFLIPADRVFDTQWSLPGGTSLQCHNLRDPLFWTPFRGVVRAYRVLPTGVGGIAMKEVYEDGSEHMIFTSSSWNAMSGEVLHFNGNNGTDERWGTLIKGTAIRAGSWGGTWHNTVRPTDEEAMTWLHSNFPGAEASHCTGPFGIRVPCALWPLPSVHRWPEWVVTHPAVLSVTEAWERLGRWQELVYIPTLLWVLWFSNLWLLRGVVVVQLATHALHIASPFECNPLLWCNMGALVFGVLYVSLATMSLYYKDEDRQPINNRFVSWVVLLVGAYIVISHIAAFFHYEQYRVAFPWVAWEDASPVAS